MKAINKRNPSLPSKEDLQRIKTEAAALAHVESMAGKSELQQARDKLLYCGSVATTTLKRQVIMTRLKLLNLEVRLLEENILTWQDKLTALLNDTDNKAYMVADRQRLHAAIQQAQRKVITRKADIQKLPTPAQISKDAVII